MLLIYNLVLSEKDCKSPNVKFHNFKSFLLFQKDSIMVKDELKDRYTEIEKKILPVKVFLEDHKNEKHYKDLYKGISTLLSPLVYEPEILFMGINSGDGAYKEMNPKTDTNETPLRMIGNDERFLNKNNLFERGTAQIAGEYLFIKGERK